MIRKFNRFELKYVIRYREYRKILPELLKHMRRDKYAGSSGKYQIASLYFDTPDLTFYVDKIDGIKYRRKLRIRVYPEADVSTGFVEIKQRINRTVQKRRIIVPFEAAKKICYGGEIETELLKESEKTTAAEIMFLVKSLRLNPYCIITYFREAFEGARFEPGLRVTFDANLKYRTHKLNLRDKSGNRFFLPPDILIMEIKVNEKIPFWLSSLIRSMECTLMRVSKYCLGMDRGFQKLQHKRIQY